MHSPDLLLWRVKVVIVNVNRVRLSMSRKRMPRRSGFEKHASEQACNILGAVRYTSATKPHIQTYGSVGQCGSGQADCNQPLPWSDVQPSRTLHH